MFKEAVSDMLNMLCR